MKRVGGSDSQLVKGYLAVQRSVVTIHYMWMHKKCHIGINVGEHLFVIEISIRDKILYYSGGAKNKEWTKPSESRVMT